MASGISAKLPLSLDPDDGIKLNKDFRDSVRQNLIMLILTVPGERIMIPDFGVGLRTFLFENDSESLRSEISSKIRQQVSIYLPVVEIVNIFFESQADNELIPNNVLNTRIEYNIIPLDFTSELLIVADETEQLIEVRPNDLTAIL